MTTAIMMFPGGGGGGGVAGAGSIDSSNSFVEIDSDNSSSSRGIGVRDGGRQSVDAAASVADNVQLSGVGGGGGDEDDDDDDDDVVDTKPNISTFSMASEQFLKNNFGGISIPHHHHHHHGLTAALHGYHQHHHHHHHSQQQQQTSTHHQQHQHHSQHNSHPHHHHHHQQSNHSNIGSGGSGVGGGGGKSPFMLPAQLYKSLFASAVLQQNSDKLNGPPTFPRNLLFSCAEKSLAGDSDGDVEDKCSVNGDEVRIYEAHGVEFLT